LHRIFRTTTPRHRLRSPGSFSPHAVCSHVTSFSGLARFGPAFCAAARDAAHTQFITFLTGCVLALRLPGLHRFTIAHPRGGCIFAWTCLSLSHHSRRVSRYLRVTLRFCTHTHSFARLRGLLPHGLHGSFPFVTDHFASLTGLRFACWRLFSTRSHSFHMAVYCAHYSHASLCRRWTFAAFWFAAVYAPARTHRGFGSARSHVLHVWFFGYAPFTFSHGLRGSRLSFFRAARARLHFQVHAVTPSRRSLDYADILVYAGSATWLRSGLPRGSAVCLLRTLVYVWF